MQERKLGKYELRGARGRGAMGIVHEAWDPVLTRRVAIKIVPLPDPSDPDACEAHARFLREAQAAGRLAHPNIVAVHDFGQTETEAYIVMEFVDGASLKGRLDRGEVPSIAETRSLMRQILTALAYSHAQGVIHRDIKPGNVLVAADGTAKITDFGIARIENSSMTVSGTLMGTPSYMSPEQFLGTPTGPRSDIYSAGALLYHLLTGQRPHDGTMSVIMTKVLRGKPPLPSSVRPDLAPFDAVIATAMARDPSRRFASAEAFLAALETGRAPVAVAAADPDATLFVTPATAPAAMASPGGGGRLGWLIGGGAAVVGLAGIAAWWLLAGAPARGPDVALVPPIVAPPAVTPPAVTPPAVIPPVAPPVLPVRPMPDVARLRAALAPIDCTFAHPEVTADGMVFVSGLGRAGRPEAALRQAVADALPPGVAVAWSINGFDGPYCEALNLLRPLRAQAADMVPTISLKGGATRLRQDDHLVLRVVVPFAAHLQLDYFSNDGSVTHLVVDDGTDLLMLTPAGLRRVGPSRRYLPGEVVFLGEPDPAAGFEGWAIDAPFGHDLLMVVASGAPLRRPGAGTENPAVYFRNLRAAIDRAQGGGPVSGQALIVETVAK